MDTIRKQSWIPPAVGLLAAITINAAVIASALPEEFTYLSLFPLMALFWYLGRYSRAEIGYVWGRIRYYGLALLQPVFVLSLVGVAAWIAGAIHVQNIDWVKTTFDLALRIILTMLLAVLTEEGFFRGWLWVSLQRAGLNRHWIVVLTGLAIAAWHLPVALMETEFSLPIAQVPIYITNIAITGVIMGLLRLISGSVVVGSISHGVWNALAYMLFGTGVQVGLLGIQESTIFRPEVGVLGLALNLVLAIGMWLWYRRTETKAAANPGLSLRIIEG